MGSLSFQLLETEDFVPSGNVPDKTNGIVVHYIPVSEQANKHCILIPIMVKYPILIL